MQPSVSNQTPIQTTDNLAPAEYWQAAYEGLSLQPMPRDYPLVEVLFRMMEPTTSKTVLEIGCFPGRFLRHFGKLGYEPRDSKSCSLLTWAVSTSGSIANEETSCKHSHSDS